LKVIYTDKAPKPLAAYSQAIKVGNTLYVSGQVAIDPETNKVVGDTIAEQTERVIKNILEIVKAAGGTLENIVKVNVYLAKPEFYQEFNRVYGKYFDKWRPARTTVAVQLPREDLLIEMDAVAIIE